MRKIHWQDIVSASLGVWLVFSPFVLGFIDGPAGPFTIGLGVAIILVGLEALFIPSYLEEWVEIVLAIGLLIAPYASGYTGTTAAYNSYAVAILVVILAVWEMLTDREFITWWHEHAHLPAH